MAINTIALASKMTGELDKAVVQKSTTGFLADNVMKSKFVGAKTVLIPDVEFSGLGDYDRDTGFVRGSITVANTSYTMGQDRARSFQLDREDNDESGVSNLAGQVMANSSALRLCRKWTPIACPSWADMQQRRARLSRLLAAKL